MNQIIFDWLYSLTQSFPALSPLIIFLARDLIYVVAAGLLVLAIIFRQREKTLETAIFTASAAILSWSAASLIKNGFPMPRPFVALPPGATLLTDPDRMASFPSGHASFLFALAFAVYFYHRRLGAVCLAAAVLVSLARVAAGVHWPIDILGGFFVALIVSFLVRYFFRIRTLDK